MCSLPSRLPSAWGPALRHWASSALWPIRLRPVYGPLFPAAFILDDAPVRPDLRLLAAAGQSRPRLAACLCTAAAPAPAWCRLAALFNPLHWDSPRRLRPGCFSPCPLPSSVRLRSLLFFLRHPPFLCRPSLRGARPVSLCHPGAGSTRGHAPLPAAATASSPVDL